MRLAVVTGASSGIGKAISLRLLSLGYRVIGISRTNCEVMLQGKNFSSINTSLNQVIAINKKLNTSVQAIYRQTNSSYYWTVRPLIRYRIANQGVVHISLRYGADYFQNTRYAFDAGTSLKINNKLIFGFSITQNYYSQTSSISDLRIRSSLKATW